MKLEIEYLILALVSAVLLYFLSDYLFDKVAHRYYADVPDLVWESLK